MTELEIVRKVEVPMAVTEHLHRHPHGDDRDRRDGDDRAAGRSARRSANSSSAKTSTATNGVLAGAILVAILALVLEFSLAGLQRRLTSKGLKLRPA